MKALRFTCVGAAGLLAAGLIGGCLSINVPDYDVPDVDIHHHDSRPRDEAVSGRRPGPGGRGGRGVGFGGYDSLAHVGKVVELAAWLQSGESGTPIEGAAVGFYLEGTLLAEARTDAAGVARAPWLATTAGSYSIDAKVLGVSADRARPALRGPPARVVISVQPRAAPLVVVDLDHCLFASRAKRVWLGSAKPMPGSISALVAIAAKHPLVYRTRSPDELAPHTRAWLDRMGYPPAPVLLAGISAPTRDAARYKSAKLADLKRSFPGLAGIVCRKDSDAETFAGRGITTFLLADCDDDDPDDLRKIAREIRRLAPRINVVETWQDVATGLLQGRRYPPPLLARRLDQQADRIERRKRREDD